MLKQHLRNRILFKLVMDLIWQVFKAAVDQGIADKGIILLCFYKSHKH